MQGLSSGMEFILVVAGLLVAVRAMTYLLTARVYLTCAARRLSVSAAKPDEVDPDELRVLESADAELAENGYRFVGLGKFLPLLTQYDRPEILRLFVSDKAPIYAVVRRRLVPEARVLVTIELTTLAADGRRIATAPVRSWSIVTPPETDAETLPEADVATLERRHLERVGQRGGPASGRVYDATLILSDLERQLTEFGTLMRERRYTTGTTDPTLDRFTLRGAFTLSHESIQLLASQKRVAPKIAPKAVTAAQLELRVVADINAASRVALDPVRAPGTGRTLLGVMTVTAVLSFIGMSLLWSPRTAAIILLVIAIHEGGHALAMRAAGYRDVNVFFVPMVGALTVGRDVGATVRQRLSVLFAGPVPGLWLAVVLLLLKPSIGPVLWLKPLALGFLSINALNLLPITPFDGGRAVETLTRPESFARLAIHGLSVAALIWLAFTLESRVLGAIGIWWAFLLWRQIGIFRLRREVSARLEGKTDRIAVIRAACVAMAAPAYVAWRGATRAATARGLALQFSQSQPTARDRVLGTVAYVCAWIPVLIALLLWKD